MITHQAKNGDPVQQVIVTDSAGTIFAIMLAPGDTGHDFAVFTNNPLTPKESLAHTLVLAANDVLHELGYYDALQDAVDLTLNLVVDAFVELDKAMNQALDDELPF